MKGDLHEKKKMYMYSPLLVFVIVTEVKEVGKINLRAFGS